MRYVWNILWIASLCLTSCVGAKDTQKFFHLGGWYPTKKELLVKKMQELDEAAQSRYGADLTGVKALIVPHAGYRYSGSVAASAFRLLDPQKVKRIILLAPCHKIVFQGVAVLDGISDYFVPNGSVALDTKSIHKMISKKLVKRASTLKPHNPFDVEHSLEVELPFIKHYVPQAHIIPLLIGGGITPDDARAFAKGLSAFIDDHTVVVASSDFTHYGKSFEYVPFTTHVKERIRALDNEVMQPLFVPSVDRFFSTIKKTEATVCGRLPLMILLALLEKGTWKDLYPSLLAYATSSDHAKEIVNSVSYAAIAYVPKKKDVTYLTGYEKESLLQLARDAVTNSFTKQLNQRLIYPLISPALQERRGAYVTLNKADELRGCMGSIVSPYPLHKTIHDKALSAAFKDGRFEPVTKTELSGLIFKVSVLTDIVSVKNYEAISIGKHGIILDAADRSAVFLPSVAREHGWTLTQTLEELNLKASLEKDAWKHGQFRVFESIDFSEKKKQR